MAASFPNAKKTFSGVVNGVTKLVAALFNSPYDEIEAIETFIGATGGGAQANSDSITGLLITYRRGCSVEWKSTSDFYVRSGEIMITDASGNKRLRRNTADTTVVWADIDTGAEASSTKYYVYATADTSTTTFIIKISTSSSAPSGSTFYRNIGSFFNNASSNITITDIINSAHGFPPNYDPAGILKIWAGSNTTVPGGYLLCDGTAISRTIYGDLFTAISTAYGVGDGSTTFNIPNLVGKVPVGFDSSQTEFDVLGETGGAKTHTLSVAEMPGHTHNGSSRAGGGSGNFAYSLNADRGGSIDATATGESVGGSTGGGTAHNVLDPYITLTYIIKY